jgi:hypothetical protein
VAVMQVVLVFEPDPTLAYADAADMEQEVEPLRRAIYMGEGEDVLVVRRSYGEQYEDGVRTEVWAQGVYENVDWDTLTDTVEGLVQGLPGDG